MVPLLVMVGWLRPSFWRQTPGAVPQGQVGLRGEAALEVVDAAHGAGAEAQGGAHQVRRY